MPPDDRYIRAKWTEDESGEMRGMGHLFVDWGISEMKDGAGRTAYRTELVG